MHKLQADVKSARQNIAELADNGSNGPTDKSLQLHLNINPLYNMVHYNTILDITRTNVGPQTANVRLLFLYNLCILHSL